MMLRISYKPNADAAQIHVAAECPECGYDLHGLELPHERPECGFLFDPVRYHA